MQITSKAIFIIIWLTLIIVRLTFAQTPTRESFIIYFENTFNDNQIGNYNTTDFQSDWIAPEGSDRLEEIDILVENNNKFMRGFFPRGCLGPGEGGWSWYAPLSQKTSEMYFSYNIRFKPGFEWVHGGKIPGIVGGRSVSGRLPSITDGFSVRPMWKGKGSLVFYVYHHDQESIYGSSYDWENFKFETGRWYNLTIRVVLNSIGPNGGENNGVLEGFVDGKLIFRKSDFRFRNYETIKIDRLYICSFFGGNDDIWRAIRDEWIDTDNYICFNYSDKILNVPHGRQVSSFSKELIHPYRKFSDAQWKGSFKFSSLSNSSIKLSWDDYPVPTKYIIQRLDPANGEFITLASLAYGTKSYIDTGLSPYVVYRYKLISGESSNDILTSPLMEAPAQPTNLKNIACTDRTVMLTWNDNSDNEDSFVLERTSALDPSAITEFKVRADDTIFVDSNLTSATSYIYTVRAINSKGSSPCSNKSLVTTLTEKELKRVREGLVAYYNFGYNPDHIVYDQSGYDNPLNLKIMNPEAVKWNENNTMDILGNTALISMTAATKIIKAIKQSNEITFESWIKPREPDYLNSRIVSLAKDDEDIGFILDQCYVKEENLESLKYRVRLQTESTIPSGYPEYLPDCLQPYISLQHLVYCRDHHGNESLYLNGEKSSQGFRPSNLCTWKDDYFLRLGNESDMNHAWRGSYYSVAIYNRALTNDQVRINYNAGPLDNSHLIDMDYTLEVLPNPVKTSANVIITPNKITDLVPKTVVRVIDIYGKMLVENTVFNPCTQYIWNVDFTKFSGGVYFIQLISGKEQKIIKVVVSR